MAIANSSDGECDEGHSALPLMRSMIPECHHRHSPENPIKTVVIKLIVRAGYLLTAGIITIIKLQTVSRIGGLVE